MLVLLYTYCPKCSSLSAFSSIASNCSNTANLLATSSITKRRWTAGDGEHHHLIDPRTGTPSESPFRTVTVVAHSCVEADVAAKTALLMGTEGLAFLERHGLHGFAVRRDGTVTDTSQWPWT